MDGIMGRRNRIEVSAISGVLWYLLKRREELMEYLKITSIPIDNDACERGLRPLVNGRKTFLFFQNLMGAWLASMRYSFFDTCSINHLKHQLDVCIDQYQDHTGRLPYLLLQNFDKSYLKLV